jgi:hypothetical protein
MTALNTISPGADDEYVFGMTPKPAEAAAMGQAWMRMGRVLWARRRSRCRCCLRCWPVLACSVRP